MGGAARNGRSRHGRLKDPANAEGSQQNQGQFWVRERVQDRGTCIEGASHANHRSCQAPMIGNASDESDWHQMVPLPGDADRCLTRLASLRRETGRAGKSNVLGKLIIPLSAAAAADGLRRAECSRRTHLVGRCRFGSGPRRGSAHEAQRAHAMVTSRSPQPGERQKFCV